MALNGLCMRLMWRVEEGTVGQLQATELLNGSTHVGANLRAVVAMLLGSVLSRAGNLVSETALIPRRNAERAGRRERGLTMSVRTAVKRRTLRLGCRESMSSSSSIEASTRAIPRK